MLKLKPGKVKQPKLIVSMDFHLARIQLQRYTIFISINAQIAHTDPAHRRYSPTPSEIAMAIIPDNSMNYFYK